MFIVRCRLFSGRYSVQVFKSNKAVKNVGATSRANSPFQYLPSCPGENMRVFIIVQWVTLMGTLECRDGPDEQKKTKSTHQLILLLFPEGSLAISVSSSKKYSVHIPPIHLNLQHLSATFIRHPGRLIWTPTKLKRKPSFWWVYESMSPLRDDVVPESGWAIRIRIYLHMELQWFGDSSDSDDCGDSLGSWLWHVTLHVWPTGVPQPWWPIKTSRFHYWQDLHAQFFCGESRVGWWGNFRF